MPSAPTVPPLSPPLSRRVMTATVTGAATVAYYATPDHVRSRTARALLKTAASAVVLAASYPDVRDAWAAAEAARHQVAAPAETATPADAAPQLGQRGKAVLAGVGVAVLAGTVATAVALEKWAFRWGEARAAAGRRLPHTGPALAYGVATAVLVLLPDPAARDAASSGTEGAGEPLG